MVMISEIRVRFVENSSFNRSTSGGIDNMHAWLYAWTNDDIIKFLSLWGMSITHDDPYDAMQFIFKTLCVDTRPGGEVLATPSLSFKYLQRIL